MPVSPEKATRPFVPGAPLEMGGELDLTETELAAMGARFSPGALTPPPDAIAGAGAPPAVPTPRTPQPPPPPRVASAPRSAQSRSTLDAAAPPRPATAARAKQTFPRDTEASADELDDFRGGAGAETNQPSLTTVAQYVEQHPPHAAGTSEDPVVVYARASDAAGSSVANVAHEAEAARPDDAEPRVTAESSESNTSGAASSAPAPAESVAPSADNDGDFALFRGDVAAVADEESLLPFFVPPGPSSPPAREPTRTEAPAPPPPWFERFFDADYLAFEPQPSAATTRREVDFIVASLGLAEGARILDLACGAGRHAVELAARGFQVVGLDYSKVLLERAAGESRARKVAADFVHGDMRSLAFRRWFDAVLCWGTSFGYFRDVENALVVRKIAQALRPGGRFLLHVGNRDFVARDAPRTFWRRQADGLIFDEIDFEPRTSRFRLRRSLLRADGRERIDTVDFRAYTLSELVSLLAAEGFVPIEVSGAIATRGVFFGSDSPQILLLAEIR